MPKEFIIYLPAYNAALTLPGVLDRIPADMKREAKEILIIDNCSADNTLEVVANYRAKSGLLNLHAIRLPRNLGYGGSQKVAYRYCIESGVDAVIMVHADGQYAPELIPMMLEPVLTGKADMVFGSRIRGNPLKGGMPIHRFLGNRALTTMQNMLLGSRLSEFHSGYRVFSVPKLAKLEFEQLSDDYHFDTEMIILHLRAKLRIVEKTIPTHYGDEENYVNIWAYGMQVLVTTGTYFLHARGLRKSKNWSRILDGVGRIDRRPLLKELEQKSTFDGYVGGHGSLTAESPAFTHP